MNDSLRTIDLGVPRLQIPYLQQELLGASLQDWLLALLVTLAGTALLVLLSRFIAARINRLAARTTNRVDNTLAELLGGVRTVFWFVIALFVAVGVAALPPGLEQAVGYLTVLALLIQVGLWGNGLISAGIRRYREKRLEQDASSVTTMNALGFMGRLLLWSMIFLTALHNFGVDVTALVASLGVAGIAIGLALQGIFGDLFASLSIVMDKPFVIGDFLVIDNLRGTVEYVGLKSTRIRSLDGEQIIFSNADLLKSRIRNFKRMLERRVLFSIGVVYQTPHEKLAAIPGMLREIVEQHEPIRFDRAHFKDYGPSSLNFEVVYWVLSPDYNAFMDIQQSINLRIFRRFADEGIEFAYPTQTLYLTNQHVEGDGGVRRLAPGEEA